MNFRSILMASSCRLWTRAVALQASAGVETCRNRAFTVVAAADVVETSFAAPAAADGVEPSSRKSEMYAKLRFLSETGEPLTENLNEFMREEDVSVSQEDLLRWAKQLEKDGKDQHALEIFEWMKRNHMPFNLFERCDYFNLVASIKGFEAAQDYFPTRVYSSENWHELEASTCAPVEAQADVEAPASAQVGVKALASAKAKMASSRKRFMYAKLRYLSEAGEPLTENLNEFMREDSVSQGDLLRWAKHLAKDGKNQHALEMFEWMERNQMSFSPSQHAIFLDLIAKPKGVAAAKAYFKQLEPSFNNLDPRSKNWPAYQKLVDWYFTDTRLGGLGNRTGNWTGDYIPVKLFCN